MPTATKKKSRKATGKGQVLVTTATFDTRTPLLRFVHERQPIADVQPIGAEHYAPLGSTPLNDATLAMIERLQEAERETPDAVHIGMLLDESFSMRPSTQAVIDGYNEFLGALRGEKAKGHGRVLCVIMTDGEENSSVAKTSDVREKISELENHEELDWTFIFLGANQDAWAEGGVRGASVSANYNASPQGTAAVFASISTGATHYLADDTSIAMKSLRKDSMNSALRSSLNDNGGNISVASGGFTTTASTFDLGSAIAKAKGEDEEEK